MRGSAPKPVLWYLVLLSAMVACGRAPSTAVPDKLKDAAPPQPTTTTQPSEPNEPVKPMKVGGEVSPPKPATRLNIRWPANPTQCYELGVVLFEGVVDKSGTLRDLRLIKGPDNEFARAARSAIEQQKFTPAMYRGKPVDVMYHVSINHFPMKKVQGPC